MKTGQELYNEHYNRLKDSIAMKKTDRPPISLNAFAFCIKYGGGKLSDICLNPEYGNAVALKGLLELGDVDSSVLAVDYPNMIGSFFLSEMKVPGRDLPEDMLWQIDEKGIMTEADYDTVLEKGWNAVFGDMVNNRLKYGFSEMRSFMPMAPKLTQNVLDAGIVPLCGGPSAGGPFGTLCAGRGIARFMRDLHRMPDKIKAVMEVIASEKEPALREQVRNIKPLTCWAGGSREAGDFLSYKDFERFAWPYLKKSIEIIIEEGSNACLHLDMPWDRYFKYFLEVPKGRCILWPDGTSDIFKARDALYGHMCFMGDASPSLMTLGSPDDVYAYCKKLVEELSPSGFIMSTGCMVPYNAKVENVKAMMAAATGK